MTRTPVIFRLSQGKVIAVFPILDSRDVIARLEELRDERDAHEIDCQTCQGTGIVENPPESGDTGDCPDCEGACQVSNTANAVEAWVTEWPDDAAELAALEAFAEQGESLSDWSHGETLIRDDYFETYAREYARELAHCDKWPATCIDWEQAADQLKQDYTPLEWDGVTYWGRS
jgi:hypothetical protein